MMATQRTVINELKPGRSWSVYWELRGIQNKTKAVETFRQLHPDLICDFQIIIELPDDEYETKGLKFIQNNLSKLMEKDSLADVKFVFKDDQVLAHSAIIAASSPVFAAMFEGGRFKEGQTRTVNVEDNSCTPKEAEFHSKIRRSAAGSFLGRRQISS